MTASSISSITIGAPAKINLGLEILGKRTDGFHEIRTLMAMLEFGDQLNISIAPETAVLGVAGVDEDADLIQVAVSAFRLETATPLDVRIFVTKHIPIAAGLGGASSDAAATLLALNALAGGALPDRSLHRIAAELGSDVPFFLGSSFARSSGTGTTLDPLPSLSFNVILVVPDLAIRNKTRRLYGMLERSDFSDGTRVDHGALCLGKGELPNHGSLANAFERPLYALAPELVALRRELDGLDCLRVGLSGAGPTHYVLPHPDRVLETVESLYALMPAGMKVISTRARSKCIGPDVGATSIRGMQ